MINKYDNFLEELHERNYSVYDNSEAEKKALHELHTLSYSIFDEDKTKELLSEYCDEFDRLSHEISFPSLLAALKEQDLFQSNTPKIEQKDISIKNQLIGNIVASIANALNEPHVFYIRLGNNLIGCSKAFGMFDEETNGFVLKQGSALCQDVSPLFRYTAEGVQRQLFISRHCEIKGKVFCLKKDYPFSSPDIAASYVLGRKANGKLEWTDKDGRTLGRFLGLNDVYGEI